MQICKPTFGTFLKLQKKSERLGTFVKLIRPILEICQSSRVRRIRIIREWVKKAQVPKVLQNMPVFTK